MTREVPAELENPESCRVRLDEFTVEYISTTFEIAVTNHGSSVSAKPQDNDSFTWRAGGDLHDYSIACEGDKEVVGGGVPVYRWYLTAKPLPEGEAIVYYLDTPNVELFVVEDDKLRPANPKDINDFVSAAIDLNYELDSRKKEHMFHIIGGRAVPNYNFFFEEVEGNES